MVDVQVTCKYDTIKKVVVTGHAESGPYGEDLVCAGASAIVIGGLNGLDELFKNDCNLILKDNHIEIRVLKKSDMLNMALEFMIKQLESMEETNPNYIRITKKEV